MFEPKRRCAIRLDGALLTTFRMTELLQFVLCRHHEARHSASRDDGLRLMLDHLKLSWSCRLRYSFWQCRAASAIAVVGMLRKSTLHHRQREPRSLERPVGTRQVLLLVPIVLIILIGLTTSGVGRPTIDGSFWTGGVGAPVSGLFCKIVVGEI